MRTGARFLTVLLLFSSALVQATAAPKLTTEQAFENAAAAADNAGSDCVQILLRAGAAHNVTQADNFNTLLASLAAEVAAIDDALSSLAKNGKLKPATPSCKAVVPAALLYFQRELAHSLCAQGIVCTALLQRNGATSARDLKMPLLQLNTMVPQLYRLLEVDCKLSNKLHTAYIRAYNQTQLAIDRLDPQISPQACVVPAGETAPFEGD